MIRDLTIIGLVITVVILGHCYVQKSFRESSNEIIGLLEDLKHEFQTEDVDQENAKEKANKIYELWRVKEDNWSLFVDHQEIDAIEKAILGVKTGIEENEVDTILMQIEESIFLVSLIEEKEKLNLRNIF